MTNYINQKRAQWLLDNIDEFFNKDGIIILDDDFDINSLTKELYDDKIDAIKENYKSVCNMKNADDILFEHIETFIKDKK